MIPNTKVLSPKRRVELLAILESRFEQFTLRHPDLIWLEVQARIAAQPNKLWSLNEMENSGGEPDCIGHDSATGEILYCDCSAESPKGRRNLRYDHATLDNRKEFAFYRRETLWSGRRDAFDNRKEFTPASSVLEAAVAMGISLLTEAQYRALQQLGAFDTQTSSWLATPDRIRRLGGALFGDRRYDTVFIYHNVADSYYAVRGFRGMLRI
jgi:hypothetical protein